MCDILCFEKAGRMCDANVKTEVKQFDKTSLRKITTEEKTTLPTKAGRWAF